MPNLPIHAPWRMDYIRSLEKPEPDGCFICRAADATTDEQRRQCLLVWSTDLSLVIINRYPYTNGHLLVAPRAHKAELEQLTRDEVLDLQIQTIEAIKLLRRAVSPQGFNIGINLGRCAGAGLPGHVHQHVVPRWAGDTNFMSVVGEVRIVPQAMSQLYDELRRVRAEMNTDDKGEGVTR
ncbi:HIT family protein [Fontivita pretiosa]|uniref:HIT family protein n=1 Tax=Fontivita pretiosa TaxID=2989684 RepID=UPI003D17FF2D